MSHLLTRFKTTPVTAIATGELPRRFSSTLSPECPHCGRFGAFITGRRFTLIHRARCVIAEGLQAQHDLDAARFLADDQLTEFTRAYTSFEQLDAEICGEFLPPDATTIVRRDSVLTG